MDNQEKERLKKEYQYVSDDEIIELTLTKKNEFKEGMYEIVLEEFKKRNLQKKIAERERIKRLQLESAGENLVVIERFSQGAEAYIVKGKLETEGIDCYIADEHLISINWLYSNAIGGVKLQVKTSDVEKAKEILAKKADVKDKIFAKKIDPKYICPKCGSDDIFFEKYNRKLWFIFWLMLAIPILFLKRKWKCQECGYQWKKK